MKDKRILLTGASGLLGRYLLQQCDRATVATLGRGEEADIRCDLEQEKPRFTDVFLHGIELVVHAAGTQRADKAIALNLEGTRRLLEALAPIEIKQFVYISSTEVYGLKEGEDINEEERLRPCGKVGQSKVLAEEEVRKFCDEKGIILTILRPATMFGKGMTGWGERMAEQVLSGYYFSIRDADAMVSMVLALDVAKVALALASKGGTYNVTDLRRHSLQQLAMAMGNNRGKAKKPFFLPMKWAKLLAGIGDRIGLARILLDSDELKRRTTTLTFSADKLREALPAYSPFDTALVIGREDKDYPYEDE